ncbi:MAG: helix-turn-helix domain-containing protein [Nitrospira sp.]|nr:helix-turn-helix domain-containing protein [Nitrospira sp.]
MSEKSKAEPPDNIQNRLKALRQANGFSQDELAKKAGLTRQAVYAIESSRYFPTTPVALRLAQSLRCRVEDIFALISGSPSIEGELVGSLPVSDRARVAVARVGSRTIVRPLEELGDVLSFAIPADGLLRGPAVATRRGARTVQVDLLRDHRAIEDGIVVAGCDPAIFLLGEYVRRQSAKTSVIGWTMGSAAALDAVKRHEVHVAGLHVQDIRSGEWNLPYLRTHFTTGNVTVVTFAQWEAGILVQRGNPKQIHDVTDLEGPHVAIVNREPGSGARALLDRRMRGAALNAQQINGYDRHVTSHVEVARQIAAGQADAGIGLRSVARLHGLEFLPLQEERYDLVIPTPLLDRHPTLSIFLNALVSRAFRSEIEALGGYDTRETGTIRDIRQPRVRR